jgi:hypothetical protein
LTAEVHVKPFRFLQQFRGTIDNPTWNSSGETL